MVGLSPYWERRGKRAVLTFEGKKVPFLSILKREAPTEGLKLKKVLLHPISGGSIVSHSSLSPSAMIMGENDDTDTPVIKSSVLVGSKVTMGH